MSLNCISYKDLKTCRYLLKFSYIGTKYCGLQRTSGRDDTEKIYDQTIQTAIENALQAQLRPVYGSRLSLSSRTDAGVHALANTAHVDLTHPYNNTVYKPSFITDSVNQHLLSNGHEIMILNTRIVPNSFHCRGNAKWRSYIYRLAVLNSEVEPKWCNCLESLLPISELNRCHIIRRPNFAEMERAANLFNGRYDFASFTPKSTSENGVDTVKTIHKFELKESNQLVLINDEEVVPNISLWIFHVKAKSFLYNQIRRMVGSIIDVGFGHLSYEHIKWMLENPSYENWKAKQTLAPAKGLWLANVSYDENDLLLKDDDDDYHPNSAYIDHNSFRDCE